MMPGIERRSGRRVGIRLFVEDGAAQDGSGLCRATDVSRSGMHLLRVPGKATSRFAWLGFRLPDGGNSIRALVEVIHTRNVGALQASGVRFKYLSPADRRRLDEYLAQAEAA